MMFWAWAGVPLGVYNIVSDFNIALQVQPQILTFLSLVTWIQCYYYERKWKLIRSLVVVVPIAIIMAAVEVSLIFALRAGTRHNTRWPITLMAVLATLFLALGVLRHYVDIYQHKTVRGISFLFIGIDAMGDLTSLISVVFQPSLDLLGIVIYAVELTLWLGVFACGGYMNLIPWVKAQYNAERSRAADVGDQRSGPNAIAIHDLPSSTSVFRTPGTEGPHQLRSRVNATGYGISHGLTGV